MLRAIETRMKESWGRDYALMAAFNRVRLLKKTHRTVMTVLINVKFITGYNRIS